MQEFDVAVIGGGPGGYVAAIKSAQLGKKVICIDSKAGLGGTCLNVGCIPSKALLNSTHKYYDAVKHFHEHGIEFKQLEFNLAKMMARKDEIVSNLNKGIEGLFKKNKVQYIKGTASFIKANQLSISLNNEKQEVIEAKNIIIATGSKPTSIPGITIDEEFIVTSSGALSLKSVPKKLLILGGGVIGLEMGSIWSRLGADVTIIEYMDRIVAAGDADISRELQKILEKNGIKFKLATKAISSKVTNNKVILDIESAVAGGNKEQLDSDILLVAIGRNAYTSGLGLDNIGITLDEKGRIPVDKNYTTNIPGVFAIGDVISGPMLAHKASEEGIAVAEIIDGQHGHINYETIPSVIYTIPEIAWVGKTEEQLKANNVEYKVGKFPFLANSRARTASETEGFVKLLACKKTDQILGAHIIGACAGELITEVSLGMEFKAAAEDIARTSHSHPGFSESVKEAALATFSLPIHI